MIIKCVSTQGLSGSILAVIHGFKQQFYCQTLTKNVQVKIFIMVILHLYFFALSSLCLIDAKH